MAQQGRLPMNNPQLLDWNSDLAALGGGQPVIMVAVGADEARLVHVFTAGNVDTKTLGQIVALVAGEVKRRQLQAAITNALAPVPAGDPRD